MRFSVDPDSIQPVLRICSKISDAKGFRPIYGYCKLSIQDNVLSISVLDSYVHFSGQAEIDSDFEEGVAIVETDRLHSIFKTRLSGYSVECKSDDTFFHISQGEFKAKLPLFRREEFPEFDFGVSNESSYSLELTPDLLSNFCRCAEAVDDKAANDQFMGLLIDFEKPNQLWICGFSNSLVHVFTSPVEEHGGFRCVLAPSCLPLLSKYSIDVKTYLKFDLEKNRAVFSNPVMSMAVTFIEDKHPKGYVEFLGLQEMKEGKFYHNKMGSGGIEESEPKEEIKFQLSDFLGALDSVSSVLGMEDKAIEFRREDRLDENQGVAELIGVNRMTQAKAAEKILSEDKLSNKLVVGLHSDRVGKALSKFESETFSMFVYDAQSPFILREEGNNDFVAVSLPLRVS